jgi:hypothetical protein
MIGCRTVAFTFLRRLSIGRRYGAAQELGSAVVVVSTPGVGSTFSVCQPILDAAPAGLLVVDDHPVNREVLARQLGLLGLAAEDGVEALAVWRGSVRIISGSPR